jgi:outer membrane protein OmpA-like peptidoglycan-associated protein
VAEAKPKAEPAPPPAAAAPAPVEPPPPLAEAKPKAEPAPPPAVSLAVCRGELMKLAAANPILFERGSSKIEAAGRQALDNIARAAKACPGVRIAIEGHTDNEGSAEHNQRLSLKRAEAVAEYLIEVGVGAEALQAEGYGTTRPVAPNTSARSRAKNRRTEIVVRP